MAHYHYMNGLAGYLPDSTGVYERRRDAIAWAEQLFGDSLCDRCYRDMSRELRSHQSKDYASHYFERPCDGEAAAGGRCFAGADYVSIERIDSSMAQCDFCADWE